MAKKENRTTKLQTRLSAVDRQRFEMLANSRGVTRTELMREAVIEYLDREDGKVMTEQGRAALMLALRPLLEALDRHHERQNGLFVRFGIDQGMLLAILSGRIPAAERKQVMDKAYQAGAQRFNRKLEGAALELKQKMSRKYPGDAGAAGKAKEKS